VSNGGECLTAPKEQRIQIFRGGRKDFQKEVRLRSDGKKASIILAKRALRNFRLRGGNLWGQEKMFTGHGGCHHRR